MGKAGISTVDFPFCMETPGGYLPEAIRNYLARLSWSHGDDEIFSTEQVRLRRWNPTEHLGNPIFFHGTNRIFYIFF